MAKARARSAPAPYVGAQQEETTPEDYRRVVYTSRKTQLTVMTLKPGQDIGMEVHDDGDQLFVIMSGTGQSSLNGIKRQLGPGSLVAVPAGTRHDIINTGKTDLKLVTVYGPPQHAPGTVHHTKAEARREEKAALTAPLDDGQDEEAHEHLTRDCAWYRAVNDGQPISEAGGGCQVTGKSPTAESQMVIKATPDTPRASTVDKPTVPPGGPGLFHVKGLHLPPYIQHLWFHLVQRYGKHDAYRVAVGVVKKWAAGVNPGGWKTKSGKGKRTHPDVQAAAQRNVAQWEADRAEAHAQARATGEDALDRVLALAAVASKQVVGARIVKVENNDPERALSKLAKATSTAHRVNMIGVNLQHARVHMSQAQAARTQAEEAFNADHVRTHLEVAGDNAGRMARGLVKEYPAEGRELAALLRANKVIPLARATDPKARTATTAHLTETVSHHISHASRHVAAYVKDSPGQAARAFNLEHASHHIDVALEHAVKLVTHFKDNYPEEARQLKAVDWPEGMGIELQDIKLAAPVSVPAGTMTAPGTKISAQLKHVPSQTVVPSPPLPPGSELPTQAECDKLAAEVEASNPDKNPVLTGACKHLRDAGVKLSKNEAVHALSSLRSAQMGILAGHYELRRNAVPVANVFTAAKVPPAAASSAHAAMAQSAKDREQFRLHYIKVAKLIDRVRRHHFHGMYGGYATARFSASTLPAPPEGGKVPHESVNYREGDGQKRCAKCYMFEKGHCTLVADPIEPDDVCDRWLPVPHVKDDGRRILERVILACAEDVD